MYMCNEDRGMCGAGCGYEPITKEEKIAVLERMEKKLQEKIEYVRKEKESLKSSNKSAETAEVK